MSTVELVDCSPVALLGQFLSTAETLPTVFLQQQRSPGAMGGQQSGLHTATIGAISTPTVGCYVCACVARVTGPVADLQRSLPCAGARQNILSLKLVASNWSYLSTTSSSALVLAAPPLRCGRPPRPSGT